MVARLVIAAPASGHGKTTVATGLMAALRRAGHTVSGHKVGPDYIDPGFHALATGRPGRNLDPHLVGPERIVPLLKHGAHGADLAIIEGVMGLYDGQLGTDGFASTAHVAELTRSPVVLVVDISHASRTIAASIHGLAAWGNVTIAGVILNKAGSRRHADEVVAAIADSVPVLGVLSRDDGIEAPARHLGLVPVAERRDADAALDRLAAQIADRVDLASVRRIAASAPPLPGPAWTPHCSPAAPGARAQGTGALGTGALRTGNPGARAQGNGALGTGNLGTGALETGNLGTGALGTGRPVIAMAGGRAFTFCYTETEELLRAAGCEVITFDPLTDPVVPAGVSGLYLGGGFPEMYAAELGANLPLLADLRARIDAGLPTVAECAGMLYLCRSVAGPEGVAVPLVGALPADAVMAPRLTLAYRTATAPNDSLLAARGEEVHGHEFHRTVLSAHPATGWTWSGGGDGWGTSTLHASYLHTHWAGHPQLAHRFVAAATHAGATQAAATRRAAVSGTATTQTSATQTATTQTAPDSTATQTEAGAIATQTAADSTATQTAADSTATQTAADSTAATQTAATQTAATQTAATQTAATQTEAGAIDTQDPMA